MIRALLVCTILFGALKCGLAGAQDAPPCNSTLDVKAATELGRPINRQAWLVCRITRVDLGEKVPNAIAALMRSVKPVEVDPGTGNATYAVRVLLGDAGKVLYDSDAAGLQGFFFDDAMEARNLHLADSPAIIFRSGNHGVSDWTSIVHVLVLKPDGSSATDVAPLGFNSSRRREFRWEVIRGQLYAIVAAPDGIGCYGCPMHYDYQVYQWLPKQFTFSVRATTHSHVAHESGDDPIEADDAIIRNAVGRLPAAQ